MTQERILIAYGSLDQREVSHLSKVFVAAGSAPGATRWRFKVPEEVIWKWEEGGCGGGRRVYGVVVVLVEM